MSIKLPSCLQAAFAELDTRKGPLELRKIKATIDTSVPDMSGLDNAGKEAVLAERLAFSFNNRNGAGVDLWQTYFRPEMTMGEGDSMCCVPDLRRADTNTIAHWSARAKSAKHPVLIARYADLVWDTSYFVTKCKPSIEYARMAIDAYVEGIGMDDGAVWRDSRTYLDRALQLALSIKDESRLTKVVRATIAYVERTAEDDKPGTYCYLFDNLLPASGGPPVSAADEASIIGRLERCFSAMTAPGSSWDADPQSGHNLGTRLISYYRRASRHIDVVRIYRAVAATYERRAKLGKPCAAIIFLREAHDLYLEVGLKKEVERIRFEIEQATRLAEESMELTKIPFEIDPKDIKQFTDSLLQNGLDEAIRQFAMGFVVSQSEMARHLEATARSAPLVTIFTHSTIKLDHGRIEADIGDDAGDPDGYMAYRMAERIPFDAPWIAVSLDRMAQEGLTTARLLSFLYECPLFAADREAIIRDGIDAHFRGDYVQAVHLLIPQIERALSNIPSLAGKSNSKGFRGGRGLMQAMNLNDLLVKDRWPIRDEAGENLRMYLVSVLAHPKGLNIRNDVSHGLLEAERFTRSLSERILHVLMAIAQAHTGNAIG